MERLDTDIGSLNSTLEQRPVILHSIRVDGSIDIGHRMINYLVRKFASKIVVGRQFVGKRIEPADTFCLTSLCMVGLRRLSGTEVRTFPPRSKNPTTRVLSRPPVPLIFRSRTCLCILRDNPPMKVSSTSTVLPSPPSLTRDFSCKAKRSRWSTNHADFCVRPRSRPTS